MSVSPEQLAAVRAAGAERRRMNDVQRQRHELAAVVDTGMLSDADVQMLYAAYRAGADSNAATPVIPSNARV